MPHKAPYVPQIGDEVVYFRQGHELYVQAVKRNQIYDIKMRRQPWHKLNLRVSYFSFTFSINKAGSLKKIFHIIENKLNID